MTRGMWDREMVALMLIAAYLPLAVFWVSYAGSAALARFALVVLVLGIWNLVFLLARAQPPSLSAVVSALAVAMLAPEGASLLQMILGISFGAVMGELVFGGWGRNVVNPATIALSFLGFGFPGLPWPDFVTPVVWAAIPTALFGLVTGVMPAAVLLGAALVATAAGLTGAVTEEMLGVSAIVLVLLVADPVTSATTTLGRVLNGALFATLVIIFSLNWGGAAPVQMAVAAALLASLAAPVLDELALSLWYARRRRRHDRI